MLNNNHSYIFYIEYHNSNSNDSNISTSDNSNDLGDSIGFRSVFYSEIGNIYKNDLRLMKNGLIENNNVVSLNKADTGYDYHFKACKVCFYPRIVRNDQ